MSWIRPCISCVGFLGVAGSLSWLIMQGIMRFGAGDLLSLSLRKLSLVLYWIPLPFLCVCLPRLKYMNGYIAITGEFVYGTVPGMTRFFTVLTAIWLTGVLVSAAYLLYGRIKLYRICRGNIPVENRREMEIFMEYADRFGLRNVQICRNDLLRSPITAVSGGRYFILLPVACYTEKELRIILEHEMNHIRSGDLRWRSLARVTMCLHWFNPLIYVQARELVYQQEIVCDLKSSIGNGQFTKKEYIALLVSLTDNDVINAHTMALMEHRNETIRRIDTMAKVTVLKRPGKLVTGACCACLAVCTMIPSTMAAAKTAQLQEQWMRAEEVCTEQEPQDWTDPSVEERTTDDGSVTEIDLTSDGAFYSSVKDLTGTVDANTRMLYGYSSMAAGSSITITAQCGDSGVTYKIGIKNKATGKMVSVSGKGLLNHSFSISEAGEYTAFVENNNDFSISMSGCATYLE